MNLCDDLLGPPSRLYAAACTPVLIKASMSGNLIQLTARRGYQLAIVPVSSHHVERGSSTTSTSSSESSSISKGLVALAPISP